MYVYGVEGRGLDRNYKFGNYHMKIVVSYDKWWSPQSKEYKEESRVHYILSPGPLCYLSSLGKSRNLQRRLSKHEKGDKNQNWVAFMETK